MTVSDGLTRDPSCERAQLWADVAFRCTRGTLVWVSASVTHLLGWDVADLLGRPVVQVCHPDDADSIAVLRTASIAGRPARSRLRVRRHDGAWSWADVRAEPADHPGDLVGRALLIDEWVAAEAAEREAASRVDVLTRHHRAIVYRANAEERVTWVTPTVAEVLGWRPDEIVGTVMGDLMHPQDHPRARAGDPTYALARMRTQDGRYRWMSAVTERIVDPEGTLLGMIGTLQDVDGLARARREWTPGR